MPVHIHTISRLQHRAFIKQTEPRRDPLTKQIIQEGDRVVFCAKCKAAFLVSSWESVGSKHCNQQDTLRDFPPQVEYLDITKGPKSSLTRLNQWFLGIVGFIKANFPYEFLTPFAKQVFEVMGNVEACKVHFIISTIFFPLVLVTIFLGVKWSSSILLLTLSIVALKHFLVSRDITTESISVFNNTSLDFLLGKSVHFTLLCFFSFKNIFQYIKNTTDDDSDFLVDLLWVLYFCLVSVVVFSLHFGLYIFSVIFILIMQELILKNSS